MKDVAHEYTDKEIAKLDRHIHSIYAEAERDLQKKLDDFNKAYKAKESIHMQEVKDGVWTQAQFDNWRRGQEFQSKQWEAKRDQVVRTLNNTNQIAVQMINDNRPDVFAVNASYMNYSLEHSAGMDFGFGVYDKRSVERLIKDNPQMLPKWKINEKKDYNWNEKKVNNSVNQGIIQGETIDQITKRISHGLTMQNENLAKTFARTAMTGAQNAGRKESLRNANEKGVEVYKQWMASLDSHTRDSHADIDGESVPVDSKFSNGLDYPGEAGGEPAEVYNCRCTMVGDIKKYSSVYSRRDNETGQVINKLGPDTVDNLNYKDWRTTKNVMQKAVNAERTEKISQTLLEASKLGSGTVNYKVGDKTSLDYKYKGFDSLFRKITTKSASKGLSKEQYAERITDALRFTNLSPTETLTDDYFKMVGDLESKGYKMVEVTNTFVNYTSYRGINTLVKSPDGYVFELQFHTAESMEIKEINHKLYEQERKLDKVKDADKIRELITTQNKNAVSIPTPPKVGEIKNIT